MNRSDLTIDINTRPGESKRRNPVILLQDSDRMTSGRKLAIVASHPVQYYAPVFMALRDRGLDVRVFYTWSQTRGGTQYEPGFGRDVSWDIPLLAGYDHEFVANESRDPGLHHFRGLLNPALVPGIEAWGAEAVLVYGWNFHSHLGAMRRFKGRKPVFFRGDSTLLDNGRGWRTLARRVALNWVYSHVDMALAAGQNSRDYFLWAGMPPEAVRIAPHCVDNQRFSQPGPGLLEQSAAWRAESDPGSMRVVFAGKLEPKKDPMLLVHAARRLGRRIDVTFFGGGELDGELRKQANGLGNVRFRGFVNQSLMPAVYGSSDLFVLPSVGPGETWGLALNEAMACGKPVIASDRTGAARDLIEQGVTGWTFRAGDEARLCAALDEAAGMGQVALGEMGKAAGRKISAWSVEASADAIASAVLDHARAW
jgi:glycosyltransferase involved in cell wall biosynthesis